MKQLKGYFSTKQLKAKGFTERQICAMSEQGKWIKLKQGLYRNANMFLQDQGFLDVCYAMPYAVITGFSALAYYELTTHIPQDISVTIPTGRKPPKMNYPIVNVFRQDISKSKQNIIQVKRGKYSFKIYDIEKTVCETIKNRNKMGMDTVKEVLSEYLKRKDNNIPKLYETAKKCRVFDTLNKILMIMR